MSSRLTPGTLVNIQPGSCFFAKRYDEDTSYESKTYQMIGERTFIGMIIDSYVDKDGDVEYYVISVEGAMGYIYYGSVNEL